MIKASELRIGNWVDVLHERLIQVDLVKGSNFKKARLDGILPADGGLVFKELLSIYKPEWVFPIPLTPDLLYKIGLITLDAETDIVVWGLNDDSNGEEFSIVSDGLDTPVPLYFEYDLGYRNVRKELKYLHELQNLYFAITGEELEFTL